MISQMAFVETLAESLLNCTPSRQFDASLRSIRQIIIFAAPDAAQISLIDRIDLNDWLEIVADLEEHAGHNISSAHSALVRFTQIELVWNSFHSSFIELDDLFKSTANSFHPSRLPVNSDRQGSRLYFPFEFII